MEERASDVHGATAYLTELRKAMPEAPSASTLGPVRNAPARDSVVGAERVAPVGLILGWGGLPRMPADGSVVGLRKVITCSSC